MLAHVDLCSGIGGFALGFQWAGLSRPVLFCDIEEWSRKVLAKHWPDVPISDDVKELANDPRRLVPDCDILSCGYPCQPFSQAGVRRGEEDDRHIWPEILTIVQAKLPRWVVCENVAGHISLGLDQVLSDLESEGYTVQPFVVPACAVDAPHRRDRVWIIASHADCESQSDVTGHGEEGQWLGRPASDDADANSQRPYRAEQHQQRGGKSPDRQEREFGSVCKVLAGRGDAAERSASDVGDTDSGNIARHDQTAQQGWRQQGLAAGRQDVADAKGDGRHERQSNSQRRSQGDVPREKQRFGDDDSLVADTSRRRYGYEEKEICTRRDTVVSGSAATANVADADSERGCSGDAERQDASDAGQPSRCQRNDAKAMGAGVTESGVGGMADGLSTWLDEPRDIPRVATGVKQRAARLKGLGNAIVPQIAMQIGLTIKAVENG